MKLIPMWFWCKFKMVWWW